MTDLTQLRLEYGKCGLSESMLETDPLNQFQRWLQQAMDEKLTEPYAMTFATVTATGQPRTRIVLLRRISPEGFQFFTNYSSHKGMELEQNAKAALLFYWAELERQVRVEGVISKTDAATSDAYFAKRPRLSQIAAVASEQSEVIANREVLEARVMALTSELEGKPVPRPVDWGGYNLQPHCFEFWQGRPNRLHDRLCYRLVEQQWKIERLSP